MLSHIQQFINNLSKPKNYLLLVNVFLVFFLIILKNMGIIPLQMGDFIFFSILTLAFALYRPGWAFLFFIGTLALENINLAPEALGIAVRPYQFIGALTIAAILIRLVAKKLNFKTIKLKWYDWLVIGINISSFFSLINASDKLASLKLVLILASFSMVYFLTRNYIQTIEDLKKVLPFFLSSSIVVVLYGIWQNISFLHGSNGFETMPGRPNATFAEADWLGIYLTLLISACYVLIYCIQLRPIKQTIQLVASYFLLTASYVLLILTVSRSAWLGVLTSTFIFLFIIFTNLKFSPKKWCWRETFYLKLKILALILISIAIVYIFHLTNFQLLNRAESTGSGLQKITISCGTPSEIHKILKQNSHVTIKNVDELKEYNCTHINLEDIEKEKLSSKTIYEVYRPDPNIGIRSQIYQKSWQEIKKHPFLGIGWGSIGIVLGNDENGNALNSSNIFLETWLGAGIIGFFFLVTLLSYILFKSIKGYYFSIDVETKILNLFFIVSWFGLIVSNFFNAGIFLGFLWIWLAITQIKFEKTLGSYR